MLSCQKHTVLRIQSTDFQVQLCVAAFSEGHRFTLIFTSKESGLNNLDKLVSLSDCLCFEPWTTSLKANLTCFQMSAVTLGSIMLY